MVLYFQYAFSYWKRRKFPFINPTIPFGNLGPVVAGKTSMGVLLWDLYMQSKKPFVGIYLFNKPALLIRDPNLVKRILVSDFDSFCDRGIFCDEENDPVSAHLFALSGSRWKSMRSKFSPMFTMSKLKLMFGQLSEQSDKLQQFIDKKLDHSNEIKLKDLATGFTVNVIASTCFGMEVDALKEPQHKFREVGKRFFATTLRNGAVNLAFLLFPSLMAFFKFHLIHKESEEYLVGTLSEIIRYREENQISRNDFVETLIKLRNSVAENEERLSIELCTAHAFAFYTGGTETTASTISFCIFELANNQTLQRKVQEEIDQVMEANSGKLSYESLAEMKLLQKCVKETLRKYPALPFLNRVCTKEYKIPDTDYIIEKGTAIVVSNLAIQMDEDYFPNSDVFDPSRFDGESNLEGYFPFGVGPHNCVGKMINYFQNILTLLISFSSSGYKMGLNMVEIAIATLLSKFNFQSLHDKVEFEHSSVVLHDKNGVKMSVERR